MTTRKVPNLISPDALPGLPSTDTNPHSTRLHGPWLRIVQALLLLLVAVSIFIFINGLLKRIDDIRRTYSEDLGLTLKQTTDGQISISTYYSDEQAAKAGILDGDILVAINGKTVDYSPGESLEDIIPPGAAGSPVVLSVRTGDWPVRQYTLLYGGLRGQILSNLGLSTQCAIIYLLVTELIVVAISISVAVFLVWRKSNDWLTLLAALFFIAVIVGVASPGIIGDLYGQPDWRLPLDAWIALCILAALIFMYVFPDGRFVPRWTIACAILLACWNGLVYFIPELYFWNAPPVVFIMIFLVISSTGVIAQIYRYQRVSTPTERQQTKWVVFGLSIGVLFGFVGLFFFQNYAYAWIRPPELEWMINDFIVSPLARFIQLLIPVTIGIAIFRYRLWDIDLVINRVLFYGSLTLLTMLVYLSAVSAMGLLFRGLAVEWVFFLATGLIAILFEPLRQRLQRTVNRLIYGERDEPYGVLTRLANTLEHSASPGEMLPSIARMVCQTLKIPYVAILIHENGGDHLVARAGQPAVEVLSFPLVYQTEIIGALQVGRRARGEEFSTADRRLLENIARQAGSAAETIRLNAELVRSRAEIVTTREEERRRLRRDLHDGLGPILASQTLKMAAVRQLVRQNPERAETMLDDIIQQNEGTVSELRRLVYGLRPPALDELGLVEAVRDLVKRSEPGDNSITVEGPAEGLPKLSAAVEVNAYRIALEGLTNATRHSKAQHCIIRFAIENQEHNGEAMRALVVQISDDGTGMPKQYRSGVGIRSMRERAEELGGQLLITPGNPQGTQVSAWLPLVEFK
jgi:signal transduction histidine kinase